MTVATAQRHLLETLVQLQRSGAQGQGDRLAALSIGLDCARHMNASESEDPLGPVLAALQDLALAVRADVAHAGTDVA